MTSTHDIKDNSNNQLQIQACFIGNFLLGDNINYNIKILEELYKIEDNGGYLCKPKILIIVSVIEAAIHDFFYRIKYFNIEGIKNIEDETLALIKSKKIDKFAAYITHARKHNLLGTNKEFYDILDDLRKIRNRVHIQNEKKYSPYREKDCFSTSKVILAEFALEEVLNYLETQYSRPESVQGFVEDFHFPWKSKKNDYILNYDLKLVLPKSIEI